MTSKSQTPWQEMQRAVTGQTDGGACSSPRSNISASRRLGVPRHNH
jgi:hypothetical protein